MLVIYSNTGEWGGVDVLIARFAAHLSSTGVSFCIIEPPEGRLRSEIPWARFICVEEIDSVARDVTHVFLPTVAKLRDHRFPWGSLSHAKAFTWVVHPNATFPNFFPFSTRTLSFFGYGAVGPLRYIFRAHTAVFDELFATLLENEAVAVMDGATGRSLKYFLPNLNAVPVIVPIPSNVNEVPEVRSTPSDGLSIGYLGRMDSMKWSAMRGLIRSTLRPLAKTRRITLYLVSEGDRLPQLLRLCARFKIHVNVRGYMPNKEARDWIVARTDVAVAMGTSALDIAGSGHPCILIDPALSIFTSSQKRFRYIHETQDWTLGEDRDFPGYVAGEHEFRALVDNVETDQVSRAGQEYVRTKHDPTQCFDLLLTAISRSRLTIKELELHIRRLDKSFLASKRRPWAAVCGSRALDV